MNENSTWQSIDDLDMFKRIECLCDAIWNEVNQWKTLAQQTVGRQLINAADSMGSNLSEGDGRFHHKDKLNFFYIARGSNKEAAYWIRRASARNLIVDEKARWYLRELDAAKHWINALISQRRKWMSEVREERGTYEVHPVEPDPDPDLDS